VNGVFASVGNAVAAHECRLQPGETTFDGYVDAARRGGADAAARHLDRTEEAGRRVFVGKAQCTRCHERPDLTNHDFADTGVPAAPAGRTIRGAWRARARSSRTSSIAWSGSATRRPRPDESSARCALAEVIDHYDRAPTSATGVSALEPLGLDAGERRELAAFLGALSAPFATDPTWLTPPEEE
jgi:cytochrome c peroxidase